MSQFKERLIEAGLVNRVFTEADVKRLIKGTPAKRYGLINKALHKQELFQLKRGVYFLTHQYLGSPISKYYIACHLVPHSYISLESALSYHEWIPEKVTVVSSVVHNGRSRNFLTPFGEFSYTYIPTQQYEFLTSVERNVVNQRPFLIASPLRALMDLVYYRKLNWEGIEFLTESLRIEEDNIKSINGSEFKSLMNVYRSQRVLNFLARLESSI